MWQVALTVAILAFIAAMVLLVAEFLELRKRGPYDPS